MSTGGDITMWRRICIGNCVGRTGTGRSVIQTYRTPDQMVGNTGFKVLWDLNVRPEIILVDKRAKEAKIATSRFVK